LTQFLDHDILYLSKVIRLNNKIMKSWDNIRSKDLFSAILTLKNAEELKRFLGDLLTEQELVEFSSRWQAAKMLNNKVPYPVIAQKTGLSSRTIARVSKWLNSGTGGYKLVLKRMKLNHHNLSRLGKGLR
jgi:TrpR-related protein YerC/YecD